MNAHNGRKATLRPQLHSKRCAKARKAKRKKAKKAAARRNRLAALARGSRAG